MCVEPCLRLTNLLVTKSPDLIQFGVDASLALEAPHRDNLASPSFIDRVSAKADLGRRAASDGNAALVSCRSSVNCAEHDTDMAGFTDHVFGLMPFVGFWFAPRIRDLGETK